DGQAARQTRSREQKSPASQVKRSGCALVSGGLDSCAMLGELAKTYRRVYPVFVRQGLVWETAELRALRRFLPFVRHELLSILHLPATDLYAKHWSTTGRH